MKQLSRNTPLLTRAEAETLKDIVIVSQQRGYAWGDYGWWKRNAWDREPNSPLWQYRKVKLGSMLTRNGTIIENRNWRRRLQSLEIKNCLMRHMESNRKRCMCITEEGILELTTFWYPRLLQTLRRKTYGLPDIVPAEKPGLNPGSNVAKAATSTVPEQGQTYPGQKGMAAGVIYPGHKRVESTDTRTDSKSSQADAMSLLRSGLDRFIAGEGDTGRIPPEVSIDRAVA